MAFCVGDGVVTNEGLQAGWLLPRYDHDEALMMVLVFIIVITVPWITVFRYSTVNPESLTRIFQTLPVQ